MLAMLGLQATDSAVYKTGGGGGRGGETRPTQQPRGSGSNHHSLRLLWDWRQESPGLLVRTPEAGGTTGAVKSSWSGPASACTRAAHDTSAHRDKDGDPRSRRSLQGIGRGQGAREGPRTGLGGAPRALQKVFEAGQSPRAVLACSPESSPKESVQTCRRWHPASLLVSRWAGRLRVPQQQHAAPAHFPTLNTKGRSK